MHSSSDGGRLRRFARAGRPLILARSESPAPGRQAHQRATIWRRRGKTQKEEKAEWERSRDEAPQAITDIICEGGPSRVQGRATIQSGRTSSTSRDTCELSRSAFRRNWTSRFLPRAWGGGGRTGGALTL